MSAFPKEVAQQIARGAAPVTNLALWAWVLAAVGLFSETLASLVRIWRESADYEHGFLIALISLVLLFRSRADIAAARVQPNPAVLPLLAIALVGWMIAYRANSEMLQQIAFPVVVMLGIVAALGTRVARIALFPVCFLYFAIPIWNHLTPLLQGMSTITSETVLGWMGVPTQVEGFNVTIPAGRFVIIEGCSGRRYLIIALALATLAGVTQGVRGSRLLMLVAFATASALLINWLRIVIIIYAGHVTNMQHYFITGEHFSLGYVLYIPLLVAVIWAARRLSRTVPHAEATAVPVPVSHTTVLRGVAGPLAVCLAAATILIATRVEGEVRVELAAPPLLTTSWQGPLPAQPDWSPAYAGAQDQVRASYSNGPQRVELYANVYGVQSLGAELVQVENSVMPREDWTVVRPIRIAAPLDAHIASRLDSRWVIAQTYVVAGSRTDSSGLAQILYGWSALWRPAPAGLLAFAVACNDDCDAAGAALSDFWNHHAAALSAMIPNTL